MPIRLGGLAPDFVVDTTLGTIRFRDWKRGRWAVLVSHPGDFTPVCTTELSALVRLAPEFARRNTNVLAISVDPLGMHYNWLRDIERLAGAPVPFPIAADPNRWVSTLWEMIHPDDCGSDAGRSTFVVDADDRVRLIHAYPASTGRDFEEVLRVIDSLQLAHEHGVVTPAGWRCGDDVMIPVGMPTAEAERRFPKGIDAKAPYLRTTPQPDRAE
jgi:alkyl hydroperoxide reductase subunit AhpC